MKFLSLILLINICFLPIKAQERVNEPKITLIGISGIVDEAIGYSYLSYKGEWAEYKKDESGSNSCGGSSFYNFFFTTAKVNNQTYYILNINYLDGAYKYPTIKQGFYTINAFVSYIFSEDEFKKMSNYQDGVTKLYEFHTYLKDKEINKENLDKLQDATHIALKSMTKIGKYSFRIKRESESIVRFILPIKFEYKILEKDWGFDKKYFEIPVSQFNKLFQISNFDLIK